MNNLEPTFSDHVQMAYSSATKDRILYGFWTI